VSMLNSFGSSTPLLFVVFVEAVGVCWFYGVSRYTFELAVSWPCLSMEYPSKRGHHVLCYAKFADSVIL
jgi:hypothetical protein